MMSVRMEIFISNSLTGSVYVSKIRDKNTVVTGNVEKYIVLPENNEIDLMFISITNDDIDFREYKLDMRHTLDGYTMINIHGHQTNNFKVNNTNNMVRMTIDDTSLSFKIMINE